MDDLNLENNNNEPEEIDPNGSLDALFLAAEQTQRLVEEQEAMSSVQAEKPDQLEEQEDVFAQMFSALDQLGQQSSSAGTVIAEAAVQETHHISPEKPEAAAEPENVEPEPVEPEASELPEPPEEPPEVPEKKSGFLRRFFEEDDDDDFEDEEDFDERSEEESDEAEAEEPKKKTSFLRRLFLMDEEIDEDDEEIDEEAEEDFSADEAAAVTEEEPEYSEAVPTDEPIDGDYTEDGYDADELAEQEKQRASFLHRFMQMNVENEADEVEAVSSEDLFRQPEIDAVTEQAIMEEAANEDAEEAVLEDEPIDDDYADDGYDADELAEQEKQRASFLNRFMQMNVENEADEVEAVSSEELFRQPEIDVVTEQAILEEAANEDAAEAVLEDEPIDDDYADDGYDADELAEQEKQRASFLNRFMQMNVENEADEVEAVSSEDLFRQPEIDAVAEQAIMEEAANEDAAEAAPEDEPIDDDYTIEDDAAESEEIEKPKKEKTSFLRRFLLLDEEDELEDDEEEELPEELWEESEAETNAAAEEGLDDTAFEDEAEPEDEDAFAEEEFAEDEDESQPTVKRNGFLRRLFTMEEDDDDRIDEAEECGEVESEELSPQDETVEEAAYFEEEAPAADMAEALPEELPDSEEVPAAAETEQQEDAEPEEEVVPEEPTEVAPVISDEEFTAFMQEVETVEEEEHPSFEQLLSDNGVEQKTEEQPTGKLPPIPQEFPEEETTVFLDVQTQESVQSAPAELFDAAELVSMDSKPEPEPEQPEEPEEDVPDWTEQPFEELCASAPPLEVLRRDGPIMAREVARQKEWILERHRAYLAEQEAERQAVQQPAPEAPAAAEEEHSPAASEDDGEGAGSVFPDRSTDKPETEPIGRDTQQLDAMTEEIPEEASLEWNEESALELTLELHEEEPSAAAQPQASEAPKAAAPQTAPRSPKKTKKSVKKPEPVLVPPQNLQKESKKMRRQAQNLARRSIAVAILAILAVYISCAADFSLLPLPAVLDYVGNPTTVLLVFLVLLVAAMGAAYDIVLDGIRAVWERKPNYSTLLVLALLLNAIHCLVRIGSQGEEIPYVCIVLVALFTQMRAGVLKASALHDTYKVTAGASKPMGVFVHGGKEPYLLKAEMHSTDAFAARTAQPKDRYSVESIFTMLAIACAVVLSVIVCVSAGDIGRLIYVLAATTTAASQIALFAAAAVGERNAARKMMQSGAAANGLRAARSMAHADTIVLTDEDLFPAGSSVMLENVELRSKLNEMTALAYAAALTEGSSLGDMLSEEVRERYGKRLLAHHVVRDPDGNVSGTIGGLAVMLGTAEYMNRHGMETDTVAEDSILLVVEGETVAVLTVGYRVSAAQFNAVQMLAEQRMTILLHSRNRQITPERVEKLYGLREGTVIVPPPEEDRALQNPAYTAKDIPCGLLAWDSAVSFAECATIARTESKLYQFGLVLSMLAAVIGMLLMAYLCFVFVPADARPIRMLLYTILWFIPVFFIENEVGRS